MRRGALRVAVVGGGIGGLTVAIALRRRGVPVEVYEQAPELQEVGAGVALSANGTRLLRGLGLRERLAAVGVEPTRIVFRHWADGSVLGTHDMGPDYLKRYGAPFCTLLRADLQLALADAVPAESLRLGRRCTGVTAERGAAKLTFSDGTTARADVVIGADGVRSVVRDAVAPAKPAVYSGDCGFRGLVPFAASPGLPEPEALQFWLGPQRHFLTYPVAGGVTNFLAVVPDAGWDHDVWVTSCEVKEAVAAFDGWDEPVVQTIGAVEVTARWALFDRVPMPRWSAGRVVLLGDAAHAMLPHQGQGANQTIEDAVTLAECLADAEPDRPEVALRRYEVLRRGRTRAVQAASRQAGKCMHVADGQAAEVRDEALADLADALAWIHTHDAKNQLYVSR